MALGGIIRRRRQELGLTQDQLAAQVGISKPYLSNVETAKAKNPPTDGILLALETALGFDGGQLRRLAHLSRTPLDVRQEHEMLQTQVQKLRGILKQLLADGPRNASGSIDTEALGRRLDAGAAETGEKTIAAGALVPIINRPHQPYPRDLADLGQLTSIAAEYVRCPDLHDPEAFAIRVVSDSMEPTYSDGDIVIFSPNTSARSGEDCFVRFKDGATDFRRYYRDDENTIRFQPLNNEYPAKTYPPDQVTGLWPAAFRMERLGSG